MPIPCYLGAWCVFNAIPNRLLDDNVNKKRYIVTVFELNSKFMLVGALYIISVLGLNSKFMLVGALYTVSVIELNC